jgi:hypothetical protein
MLSNDAMKPMRYALWAEYRRMLRWAKERIAEGRAVYFTTYTNHSRVIDARSIHLLEAKRNGLFLTVGKGRIDLSGCSKLSAR